jgi:hypothetical protein
LGHYDAFDAFRLRYLQLKAWSSLPIGHDGDPLAQRLLDKRRGLCQRA